MLEDEVLGNRHLDLISPLVRFSQVVLAVKNPPANAKDIRNVISTPGSGRHPWRRALEAHSSTLAWRIPWTEEPGRLQPIELQRV